MSLEELAKQDTARWSDHFLEPHTGALYRRDSRGNWYDVEGVRLMMPVFLHGDVLVSLPGKTSTKSFAFLGQPLYVSPNRRLIQVGKLVLDQALSRVRYFGDRLAGLGSQHIDFGGRDVWQEVLISLNRRGFLNEFDGRPLVVNGEEIVRHVATRQLGGRRYDTLASKTRRYVVVDGSADLFSIGDHPVDIDLSTYVRFRKQEVAKANAGSTTAAVRGLDGQYLDLVKRMPFRVPSLGDVPIYELNPLPGPRAGLFRVHTSVAKFVFDAETGDVFSVDGGELLPQDLRLHPDFPNYLLIVTVGGEELVCYRDGQTTLAFGERFTRVKAVHGKPGDRLLNAVGTRGEQLVLDTVHGLGNLTLARAGDGEVDQVIGEPFRLGSRMLQRATLRRTGGPVPRVLVINDDDLPLFTLPADLKAYDDRPPISNYAGAPIVTVAQGGEIEIGDYRFVLATFISFTGSEENVLLNAADGRPLHLDGDGHRNELVTSLVEATLRDEHHLGDHTLVGAHTLTEDHNKGEVLFSIRNLRSWLPFYDGYLPILRRRVPFSASGEQSHFMLYELREAGPTSEYLAAERDPPYRVLVQRLDDRYIPNVITNKDRALPNPEQMTALRSFLTRAGTLVDVP